MGPAAILVAALSQLGAGPGGVQASKNCLAAPQVERLRADLNFARPLFRACKRQISAKMRRAGLPANRNTTRAVLAMALAHRFAPYGPHAGAIDYQELARLTAHECSSYTTLTSYIYEAMGGDMGRDRIQGWEGGAAGNHTQLWVDNLLLDPTVGLAAHISLRRLISGGKTKRIVSLSRYPVGVGTYPPPHRDYMDVIQRALRRGLYRREDVLFSYETVEKWYGGPSS
jgi:hypothetical protein